MKITKRQLRKIIREEKQRLLKESFAGIGRGAPSPMKSRVDAEFAAAIKGNRLSEIAPGPSNYSDSSADETELDWAIKNLMSVLRGMDPMERNPEVYALIEDLEDLANRG